jgi:hypothetical protein
MDIIVASYLRSHGPLVLGAARDPGVTDVRTQGRGASRGWAVQHVHVMLAETEAGIASRAHTVQQADRRIRYSEVKRRDQVRPVGVGVRVNDPGRRRKEASCRVCAVTGFV